MVGDSCQPFSSPTAASPQLWALSSRGPSPLSCLWQPINFLLWKLGDLIIHWIIDWTFSAGGSLLETQGL